MRYTAAGIRGDKWSFRGTPRPSSLLARANREHGRGRRVARGVHMTEPREGESRGAFRKRRWREQSRTLDAQGNLKSVTEVRRGRKLATAPMVGVPLKTSTLVDKEGR